MFSKSFNETFFAMENNNNNVNKDCNWIPAIILTIKRLKSFTSNNKNPFKEVQKWNFSPDVNENGYSRSWRVKKKKRWKKVNMVGERRDKQTLVQITWRRNSCWNRFNLEFFAIFPPPFFLPSVSRYFFFCPLLQYILFVRFCSRWLIVKFADRIENLIRRVAAARRFVSLSRGITDSVGRAANSKRIRTVNDRYKLLSSPLDGVARLFLRWCARRAIFHSRFSFARILVVWKLLR